MSNRTVILFNGPPGCGKDSAVDRLHPLSSTNYKIAFKNAIYKIAAEIYGIEYSAFKEICTDRDKKETIFDILDGKTPRQTLIEVSEKVIKPFYGKDFFGKNLARKLTNSGTYLISDGGFPDELLPVINEIGSENVFVVRIRGRGSFEGDSRDYFTDEFLNSCNVRYWDVDNTGTLDEFYNLIEQEIYISVLSER